MHPTAAIPTPRPAGLLLADALVATALIESWFWPGPMRDAWDRADQATFFALNGSLVAHPLLADLFALGNSRLFDLLPALALLAIYGTWMVRDGRDALRARIMLGVALAAFVVVWQQVVVKNAINLYRDSASLVLVPPLDLRDAAPWVPWLKTQSRESFPGDHTSVSLMVALIIGHVAGWRRGALALATVPLASLPRLYSGAHWLTDVLVGGFFCGLSGAALFLTGVRAWCRRAPRSSPGTA